MSRNLPSVPSNTCPDIDNVVEGLDNAEKAHQALDNIDFSGLRHLMEQLRSANDALRQNYEHQLERADDLEKERDTALTDKESAEATLAERDKDLDVVKGLHADTVDQLEESHKREIGLEERIKALEESAKLGGSLP